MADKVTGKVGRQPTGLRGVIQGGGAGVSSIWVGDVGGDPLHGKFYGKVPAQGLQAGYGEAVTATGVWDLVVPTTGDINGGGGV